MGTQAVAFVIGVAGSAVLLDYSTLNSSIQPLIRDSMRRLIMSSVRPDSANVLRMIQENVSIYVYDNNNHFTLIYIQHTHTHIPNTKWICSICTYKMVLSYTNRFEKPWRRRRRRKNGVRERRVFILAPNLLMRRSVEINTCDAMERFPSIHSLFVCAHTTCILCRRPGVLRMAYEITLFRKHLLSIYWHIVRVCVCVCRDHSYIVEFGTSLHCSLLHAACISYISASSQAFRFIYIDWMLRCWRCWRLHYVASTITADVSQYNYWQCFLLRLRWRIDMAAGRQIQLGCCFGNDTGIHSGKCCVGLSIVDATLLLLHASMNCIDVSMS